MSNLFAVYERSRHLLPDHGCLTWIKTGGSDAAFDDLVRRFGGDPSTVHPGTWEDVEAEAYDELDDEADGIMMAARHGDWTILMEVFNIRGTSLPLLRQVSAGTQAYSVRWTVNFQVSVSYVVDGDIVVTFDPFYPDGVTPSSGRAWLEGLTVTADQWRSNWMAAALAVGEELSGVRVDGQWLSERHLGVQLYPLPPRPLGPDDLLDADMRAIAESDPRIGAIAFNPTADKLPEIIQIGAELAVATTGLQGPVIDEAMRLIREGDRGEASQNVRAQLFRLRDQYMAEAAQGPDGTPGHDTEHGRLLLKERAVQALIHALNPDEDLAAVAQDTIRTAGETHLNAENGDRQRERTLSVIAYYLLTGESPW